ncbi:MAG: SGNH/GDSL hydrolase family protein [Oscillospiraceae bacterium]|jgi:lysophospholipase L1-like esterase|nr:SGNH/GDSL hydrolase family protein [Oscillospiraceae bacterium]
MFFRPNDTILFQGDSVTDCGRSRQDDNYLGSGYPAIIKSYLDAERPEFGIRVVNRGVSGDRAKDLASRWDNDCVAVNPDIISILIGINDTWRRYDSNDPTGVDSFARTYRGLLERAKTQTKARSIILMDPFVLPTPEDRREWRVDLDPRINAVRDLAREYKAVYVPLDALFARASIKLGCAALAADGVHPTPVGHALIARQWIKAVRLWAIH